MGITTVVETVGRTPLVRLERISRDAGVELLAKLEAHNPAGSIKDRIARAMVDDAEQRGLLRPGATIIEPTSGNTGIALAMIAAARGYRLILTMPETMSEERQRLLRAYGAEVVLTPGTLMRAAVEQAEVLGQTTPGAVLLKQFDNPANPRAHETGTAVELLEDTGGKVDVFVAGVGTGGTITGVGRALRRAVPDVRIVAVEPARAAVLSGGKAAPHAIQGIGAGFVPSVLDRSVIDEVIAMDEDEAMDGVRRLARSDGILSGISSGASLAAALRLARRPELKGKRMVMMLCDTGERYMSTSLYRGLTG